MVKCERRLVTNVVELVQIRFPRSKKRRIQKKWKKQTKNWGPGKVYQWTVPPSIEKELRRFGAFGKNLDLRVK